MSHRKWLALARRNWIEVFTASSLGADGVAGGRQLHRCCVRPRYGAKTTRFVVRTLLLVVQAVERCRSSSSSLAEVMLISSKVTQRLQPLLGAVAVSRLCPNFLPSRLAGVFVLGQVQLWKRQAQNGGAALI